MWQPPMEGEDMDETASGNEQQHLQQSVAGDEKKVEDKSEDVSRADKAEPSIDKVR